MQESLFTRIIKGEIPCHKVYEDDKTLVFMDIHPIQPGHVLVVSKVQLDPLWNLPEEDYLAMWNTVQKVARRLKEVFPDKSRVAALVEGLDVAHAHIKVFPFSTDEEFRAQPDTRLEPDHAALAEMARKLAF